MNSQNAFSHPMSLQQLGWQPVFQQQLTLEDYDHSVIARIVAHHRSGYTLASEQGEIVLPIHQKQPAMTVGDWVMLNSDLQFDRLLDRQSLFRRKAAGSRVAEQYISANIDTVFIVVSLNNDFNLSRIERYLALANEAQVEAVIVLTKKDLCDDYQDKVQQVQSLDPMLMIEAVNSLDQDSTQVLSPWCKTGKTVALMGSSGVGKSTLVNSLLGETQQETGGLLIDTPGMRELQLADCAEGVSETFSDVEELAMHCCFSDCNHESEPGCTIRKAIESGELSERRFSNYEKLLREQARNGASLAEQRANSKQLSKMYKTVQSESRNIKKSSK
ncbi:ribosome small subunit-dependent GTPase A [Vibrio splendidus]